MRDWQEDRGALDKLKGLGWDNLEAVAIADHWLNQCKEFAERNVKLDRQVTELEAQCAAMREVLVELRDKKDLWKMPKIGGQDRYAGMPPGIRKIDGALSSTAGQDLLKRVERMEAVVKAAVAFYECCADIPIDFPQADRFVWLMSDLKDALEAYREG